MKYEELITPAGKLKLRQNVLREVNKTLPPKAGTVRDVFLSEFVVQ
jgi:flagellar basal body-associated protein FliL